MCRQKPDGEERPPSGFVVSRGWAYNLVIEMTSPTLPEFQTIAEAAEWAETHDTAPYFDSMADVPPFELERPRRNRVQIRVSLPKDALIKLRLLAKEQALDYHTLAEAILLEHLSAQT